MTFTEKLRLSDVWNEMRHIDLAEMSTVRLMNRVDTKFVTHQKLLIPILERAAEQEYNVQFLSSALSGYDTTYYDTDQLEMYMVHHNRKRHRLKVRCRTYTDSGIAFLEIKDKSNKGRTRKIRIPVEDPADACIRNSKETCDFIRENTKYTFGELKPALKTCFQRITLVNKQKTERITIDVALQFTNMMTGNKAELTDMIIIELKQDGRFPSTMQNILQSLRIKPFHLSKYCVGTAMTNPYVKTNRFKRKIHLINKLRNKI